MSHHHKVCIRIGTNDPDEYLANLHAAISEVKQLIFERREPKAMISRRRTMSNNSTLTVEDVAACYAGQPDLNLWHPELGKLLVLGIREYLVTACDESGTIILDRDGRLRYCKLILKDFEKLPRAERRELALYCGSMQVTGGWAQEFDDVIHWKTTHHNKSLGYDPTYGLHLIRNGIDVYGFLGDGKAITPEEAEDREIIRDTLAEGGEK